MLRALVLVLCIILIESRTDIGRDEKLLERVKRWRDFDCPPQFYPHQHRYHYNPPPYWHHRPPGNDDYNEPYPEPEPEPQGRYPGITTEGNKIEKKTTTEAVANKNEKRSENLIAENENKTPLILPKIPECDNCNNAKSAISNAESETGDAIAISISRKN